MRARRGRRWARRCRRGRRGGQHRGCRSLAASPRRVARSSSCRPCPSRRARGRARSAAAGRRRPRGRGHIAGASDGSGVQGESMRTSSPTPSRASEHAQRGDLGRPRRAPASSMLIRAAPRARRPAGRAGAAGSRRPGARRRRGRRRSRARASATSASSPHPRALTRRTAIDRVDHRREVRAASSHSSRRSSRCEKLARSRASRRTWIASRSASRWRRSTTASCGPEPRAAAGSCAARAAPSADPRPRARPCARGRRREQQRARRGIAVRERRLRVGEIGGKQRGAWRRAGGRSRQADPAAARTPRRERDERADARLPDALDRVRSASSETTARAAPRLRSAC